MNWKAFGDWGTSNLRLFRVEEEGIADIYQGPGIGNLGLAADAVLRAGLSKLGHDKPASEIRLVGMAGSRAGILETPYTDCPADAADWASQGVSHELRGIPLRIAAGLACEDAKGRPDVMRGEEAQIFGALALDPDLARGCVLFVMPGTHSKWAQVKDGQIVAFRTFLSGELFDLLAHSTLLAAGTAGSVEEEEAGFAAGLDRAAEGEGLAASVFAVRSMQLRAGHSGAWAKGFLSGLVIGDEIDTMRRLADWPDRIALVGAPALCGRYQQALAGNAGQLVPLDGQACVLRGLELLDADS